jgi:carbon monoxide dehydrogenase subunit G
VALRTVQAPPEAVYAFLADLENHWALTHAWLDVEELAGDANGAEIVVRGPLGIHRRARTRLRGTSPPRGGRPGVVDGTATAPEGTTARVTWSVDAEQPGTVVRLEADVDPHGLDRVLLGLGGSWWLRRALRRSMRQLDAALQRR